MVRVRRGGPKEDGASTIEDGKCGKPGTNECGGRNEWI